MAKYICGGVCEPCVRYADLKLCHVSCHIFESVVGFCEMRGEGQGGSLWGLLASLRASKSHDLLRVMAERRKRFL